MGEGQVNTVNGDFVFEVSEGYLIKNGKISDPIRGASLVGNGPKVLMSINQVGNDLGFGIGICGKDGQGVPISDAQSTLRIPEIIVGGTWPSGAFHNQGPAAASIVHSMSALSIPHRVKSKSKE